MKNLLILFLVLIFQTAKTQIIIDRSYTFTDSFEKIEDSIRKKINPANTLIYKTCEGYRAFYLIKDSLHWNGYFIKNLMIEDMPQPDIIVMDENHTIIGYQKREITQLATFNADSIYKKLVALKIYSVNQLTEDSIKAKYNRVKQKKEPNTFHGLPVASHDRHLTIEIYGKKNKTVTYRGALVNGKDLHSISSLKIFYRTQKLLIDVIGNYYN